MKLQFDALETLYGIARRAAATAAGRLTEMTGMRTEVGVTRLQFANPATLRSELDDGERKVGIRVEIDEGIPGTTAVVFPEPAAAAAVSALVEGLDGLADGTGSATLNRSAITELAQVMNNAFVDGWANALGDGIDVAPPEFVAGGDAGPFLAGGTEPLHDDLAVLFRSRIDIVDGNEPVGFEHYLLPRHDALDVLLERGGGPADGGIEHGKIVAFDRVARHGADRAARNLSRMTGTDATVDVRRINFFALDALTSAVPSGEVVGVGFGFDGLLDGYLLFLFEAESAREIVRMAGGDAGEGGGGAEDEAGFDAMARDALGETCNIMASGMLDGWANVLGGTIDHTTPTHVRDRGGAVVDAFAAGLPDRQTFAFVFDTRVAAVDRAFAADIYVLPDEVDLERALSSLDTVRAGRAAAAADVELGAVDADPARVADVADVTDPRDAGKSGDAAARPGEGKAPD